jgi:outer membrane protein assembly factor BamA
VEGDFRYTYTIKKATKVATRSFLGVGVPFGNSFVMPYIKQYFGGGSVSMRGWQVRTLGPGSFNYRNAPEYTGGFPDQTGDIKIELNAELRFDIIKFIKGAVFVDAGNVWLMREDESRPGANFEMNRFYKEISVGSGFGTRFDLNYFVLRFDVGFKVFDPTENPENRWAIKNIRFNEDRWLRNHFTLNLALGYPF